MVIFAAHQAAEKAVKAMHPMVGQEAWGRVIIWTHRSELHTPTMPPAEKTESARHHSLLRLNRSNKPLGFYREHRAVELGKDFLSGTSDERSGKSQHGYRAHHHQVYSMPCR